MSYDDVIALLTNDTAAPHCWSGWIQGEGYILNAQTAKNRKMEADYSAQLSRARASLAENLQWAADYAEPGYDKPEGGILFADWNVVSREAADTLEAAGFVLEWSDEWAQCDDCQRAVRTQPDGHGWRPVFHLTNDCELICRDCCQDAAGTADDYDDDSEAV